MLRLSVLVALLALCAQPLASQQQQQTAKAQPPPKKSAPKETSAYKTALERLYRLIWPLGQTPVDIAGAVSASTEKAGPASGVPQLFLVNTAAGSLKPWPDGFGVSQFSVCPDAITLVYLRGDDLYREAIQVSREDVSAAAPTQKIPGIHLAHLFACIEDERGGTGLWAENDAGKIKLVRLRNGSGLWEDLQYDSVLASFDPAMLAHDLAKLHSIRPDGFVALIRNHRLWGQRDFSQEPSLLVDSDLPFSQEPNWVGNTPFLFVIGSIKE